jgi:hypothetical protein
MRLREALSIAQKLHNDRGMASARRNLCLVKMRRGRPREAAQDAIEAMR